MIGAISKICTYAVLTCLLTQSARADVILNSLTGSVSASIDAGPAVTGSTTLSIGSVSRTFTGTDNNFTTSTESQTWNNLTKSLTASGLITESKTLAARPGGTHNGLSSLTFVFSTTANTTLSLSGDWGFVNDSVNLPDSISWSLTGPSVNLSQSATAGGGNAQPFFASTPLGIGTFTFTISANFSETINNVSTRSANWNLTSFQFASVPENSSLVSTALFGGLLICFVVARQRRFREMYSGYLTAWRTSSNVFRGDEFAAREPT